MICLPLRLYVAGGPGGAAAEGGEGTAVVSAAGDAAVLAGLLAGAPSGAVLTLAFCTGVLTAVLSGTVGCLFSEACCGWAGTLLMLTLSLLNDLPAGVSTT